MRPSRKLLMALADPFILEPQPYAAAARKAGMSEAVFLQAVRGLLKDGHIRRMGIVYGHMKVGYTFNAMIVWEVDNADVERVGKAFMAFAAVTHCYFRHTYPSWPYNMYTMLHARSDRECRRLIRQLAEVSGVRDYKVLDTIKEFKKTKTDLKEILK